MHNEVCSARLPAQFDGFATLHISDLHADMRGAMTEAARLVVGVSYDLCVLTEDYRGRTFCPYEPCLRSMLCFQALRGDVYG